MNYALSFALSISVLTLLITATKASGWRLVWMVFSIYFGIGWINTLDEAVLFHVMPIGAAFQAVSIGAITAFIIAVVLAVVLNRLRGTENAPAAVIPGWPWRAVAGAIIYLILYLVAGIAVYPFIKNFYSSQVLPSLGKVSVIQLFRGLLYIAMVFPFIKRMAGRRIHAGMVLGLCFSMLGGIAPLLLPNPYMPASIRFAHSIEVGTSNFLFGLAVAYLLVTSTAASYSESSAHPATL